MEIQQLENWLVLANRRYADEQIPHIQRPWKAMSELVPTRGVLLFSGHPIEKYLFSWFEKNSPAGSHDISTVFVGAFYFDATFWPVQIGLLIGCAQIDPLISLRTMPNVIKHQLAYSKANYSAYIKYWADCWDYCYGLDSIEKSESLSPRALKFAQSGNKELKGALSQLTIPSPNVKAILSFRLSIEIFLKTVLIQEQNLSEKQLMDIGHSIKKAANECLDLTGDLIFSDISLRSSTYPAISDRYEFHDPGLTDVWSMAQDAQAVAAAVARKYGSQDILTKLIEQVDAIPDEHWKYD